MPATELKEAILEHETQEQVDKSLLLMCVKSIITLNDELGTIQGELKILKWLMGGTLLVALGEFVRQLVVG